MKLENMKHILCVLAVLVFLPSMVMAEYDAVISVEPAVDGSCIAVEISTSNGASLSGLRWYHNDGQQVFPRVVIIEGTAGAAPDLTNPGLILDEVTGVSADWGTLTLGNPVTSSTGTAFAVFFFPEGESTSSLGAGGGPGIGLQKAAGENPPFYLSSDGMNWAQFDPGYALGVEPMYASMRGQVQTIVEVGMTVDLPEPALQQGELPQVTGQLSAHPNPFNPRVTLSYSLSTASAVELTVYDVRGRVVRTLVSGRQTAGEHTATWGGKDDAGQAVASGIYFARFDGGGVVQSQRMVLLK